jgi:hypothetical protein
MHPTAVVTRTMSFLVIILPRYLKQAVSLKHQ